MKRTGKKTVLSLILVMMLIFALVTGCSAGKETQTETEEGTEGIAGEQQETEEEVQENREMILATTTSTEDSGLLDAILPDFEEKTGIRPKVVAVGTGNAIQMGEDGEADVLLVHAKASEEEFVAAGHGLERFDVMYNDFVIIGPEEDPAGISENPSDVVSALTSISESQSEFISRGDDSGTHKKELQLWEAAGIEASGEWYIESGQGMGDTIQMANEKLAYTIADRATYLKMSEDLDLQVLVEGDEALFNQYGVIAVNPDKNDQIKAEEAQEFIDWLLSEETQATISEYGEEEFGEPLFTPNAK